MTVEFTNVNSANVSAKNTSADVFQITANVQINQGTMRNIDNGEVKQNGVIVASFSYWEENHLSISYLNVDVTTQNSINTEVNAFVAAAKEAVSTSPISI